MFLDVLLSNNLWKFLFSKTPIIWDEWIGEAKGDYLGWKPIIEIWRGTPELEQATKEGLKGSLLYSFFYLQFINFYV